MRRRSVHRRLHTVLIGAVCPFHARDADGRRLHVVVHGSLFAMAFAFVRTAARPGITRQGARTPTATASRDGRGTLGGSVSRRHEVFQARPSPVFCAKGRASQPYLRPNAGGRSPAFVTHPLRKPFGSHCACANRSGSPARIDAWSRTVSARRSTPCTDPTGTRNQCSGQGAERERRCSHARWRLMRRGW